MDIFPSFDKEMLRKEAFRMGCIDGTSNSNENLHVYIAKWNKCVEQAEVFYTRDSD